VTTSTRRRRWLWSARKAAEGRHNLLLPHALTAVGPCWQFLPSDPVPTDGGGGGTDLETQTVAEEASNGCGGGNPEMKRGDAAFFFPPHAPAASLLPMRVVPSSHGRWSVHGHEGGERCRRHVRGKLG
jgi:hypothetical protein